MRLAARRHPRVHAAVALSRDSAFQARLKILLLGDRSLATIAGRLGTEEEIVAQAEWSHAA